MKLIVGLGNPGKQYELTRHNVGFLCLNRIANRYQLTFAFEGKFQAEIAIKNFDGEKCIFVKPQTYMNLSGEAVGKIAKFYKIDPSDVIVIHDDMDIPLGTLRLREKGSAGGHNGIKNIILHLGTESFKRIRVGISGHANIDAKDYVLGKFNSQEQADLAILESYVSDAIDDFINGVTFSVVMGKYNGNKLQN